MSTDVHPPKIYKFGPYSLDPTEGRLLRANEPVSLAPKTFETLVVLVKRHGHLVQKEELLNELWADSFVEEGSLSHHIYLLRKALSDEAGESAYIETVPRRGYRFVAPVEELSAASDVETFLHERHATARIIVEETIGDDEEEKNTTIAREKQSQKSHEVSVAAGGKRRRLPWVLALVLFAVFSGLLYKYLTRGSSTPTPSTIKSLAVLPFQSLGQEQGDEQLGLGMADAIIIKLSTLQKVAVLPTSSIYGYTGREHQPQKAGQELGVDAVLDGTVQRAGGRVRVTAQLISTNNGRTIWSGKFDSRDTDLFDLQDSISAQISTTFNQHLTLAEKNRIGKRFTSNAEAYEAYIMGVYFYNQRTEDGLRKAVDYLQQAIALDQNYALAYAVLSDALRLTAYYGYQTIPKEEAANRARAAALRALELDDSLAEAHMAHGGLARDWRESLESYRRAIQLNPNFATAYQRYAWLLLSLGRREEALQAMRKAVELDPLSKVHHAALGTTLVLSQQYDEAIKHYRRTLELDPSQASMHLNLGDAYISKGLSREAVAEYEKVKGTKDYETAARESIVYAYAVAGQVDAARQLLHELETEERFQKDISSYNRALIYNALGEHDRALKWLNKDDPNRFSRHLGILYDSRLNNLRADPRFEEILRNHID